MKDPLNQPRDDQPSRPDAFEPKVLAFCCTYCAYTAGDLAGSLRLSYAPNVRVVKLLCSGKIDAMLLLRAFADGADAIYVAGCALGDCHFREGNRRAIQTVAYTKKLLAEIGLEPQRLEFFHIPASAGPLFAERANQMTELARQLGPNPLRAKGARSGGGKLPSPLDPHPPLPPFRHARLIRHHASRESPGSTPPGAQP
jgi:coenzyme F420-reducing hydrogenase delta subunit